MLHLALVFFLIAAGWARDPPVSVFPEDDDDPDSVHFWEDRTEVPEESGEESAEEWEAVVAEVDTPDCEGSEEVGSENHHFYFCYFFVESPFTQNSLTDMSEILGSFIENAMFCLVRLTVTLATVYFFEPSN
jgi:hypothetical protein